jgi:hypothetical protein
MVDQIADLKSRASFSMATGSDRQNSIFGSLFGGRRRSSVNEFRANMGTISETLEKGDESEEENHKL